MFSSIHLFACIGFIFHPELQLDTTSMNEVPFLSFWFSKAVRIARLVLRTAAAVCTACLVAKKAPSSQETISVIFKWCPIVSVFRPFGEVEVFISGMVVGAI